MKALVVYESCFGNTEAIARAIGAGLASSVTVEMVEIREAPQSLEGFDLSVVGGPTHAFGMTRRSTREDAEQKYGGSAGGSTGLREWIGGLHDDGGDSLAATFDTRIVKVRHLPGSAAKAAAKAMRGKGYRMLVPPRSYYVTDVEGPLVEGEVDRARAWGEELAAALLEATQSTPRT
jgi:flavodoxin